MMVKRHSRGDAGSLEIGGDPWMTYFAMPSRS